MSLTDAKKLDSMVKKLLKGVERSWVRIAQLCERCNKAKLYKDLGFKDFASWLEETIGRHKSVVYKAISTIRELAPDVSEFELGKMTLGNAAHLARVPSSKRRGLVRAAQDLPEKEFIATVGQRIGDLHLEAKVHVQFWLDKGVAENLELSLQVEMERQELATREAAFESILADWMIRNLKKEEYEREKETGTESEAQAAAEVIAGDGGHQDS